MGKVQTSPVAAALIGATIALLPASAQAWPSDWHVLGWGGPAGYYRYGCSCYTGYPGYYAYPLAPRFQRFGYPSRPYLYRAYHRRDP
jgi:hypothetical protein